MTRSELALIARTVPHLQPGQVAQRARLRAQRTALRRWPQTGRWLLAGPDPASAVGWPGRFSTIDAGIWRHWPGECGLRAGRIELLGLTRTLAAATSAGLFPVGLFPVAPVPVGVVPARLPGAGCRGEGPGQPE